jgi:CubicO group peptidase (beta-lactamase class C family)
MADEHVIEGWVDPRYERVQATFRELSSEVGRGGAAFCASVGGTVVADLWCGQADADRPWAEDTAAALFSSTKGMTAACIALLHDRGQLDVDQPVASCWPEFAAAGKGALTVRQVLAHTCGLTEVPDYRDLMGLDGRGFAAYDEIRSRLAASTPQWEPGTGVGYHVMTYGYLAGAIIERVDGRSLARYWEEELAGPLELDLQVGASDERYARKSTTLEPDPLPEDGMGPAFEVLLAAARDESTIVGRACMARDGVGILDVLADLGNSREMLRDATTGGVGSGDGIGTARGLAHLYRHLVDPAPNDATPSTATLESMNRIELMGLDMALGIPNAFGVGFGRMFSAGPVGPSPATFGHGGAGGQLGLGDPEHEVAIGFTRSHLSLTSPLALGLITALYEAKDMSASPAARRAGCTA